SAASICAMACAAFREKRRVPALGGLGIALALAAGALAIVCIWSEPPPEPLAKVTLTLVILSIGSAHAEVLWLLRLQPRHQWAQALSSVAIAALAGFLSVMVWAGGGDDHALRALIVLSILVGLLTLVVPVLAKLGAPEAHRGREQLVLARLGGDLWRDAAGAT